VRGHLKRFSAVSVDKDTFVQPQESSVVEEIVMSNNDPDEPATTPTAPLLLAIAAAFALLFGGGAFYMYANDGVCATKDNFTPRNQEKIRIQQQMDHGDL